MANYQVIRPWHGVKMGQVIGLEKVHPAIAANVRLVAAEASSEAGEAAGIVAKAKAEADELRAKAEAELGEKIHEALEDAQAERDKIIAEARSQADAILADARAAASPPQGALTPATPDVTADKAKAQKAK